MHSNEIERHKAQLKLTRLQRELIAGKLLGDGRLESLNGGRTYRLRIEHSPKQKEYVDWFYQHFRSWVRTSPRLMRRGTKYGFVTYTHPVLRFYGQQFYQDREKRIPPLIKKLFTATALAVWYLDDGSWKSKRHSTFIIHSHGYTKKELQRVKRVLWERFKIETALHKQLRPQGSYLRLYIASSTAERFRALVAPIVRQIPSMSYKLGNTMPKR